MIWLHLRMNMDKNANLNLNEWNWINQAKRFFFINAWYWIFFFNQKCMQISSGLCNKYFLYANYQIEISSCQNCWIVGICLKIIIFLNDLINSWTFLGWSWSWCYCIKYSVDYELRIIKCMFGDRRLEERQLLIVDSPIVW